MFIYIFQTAIRQQYRYRCRSATCHKDATVAGLMASRRCPMSSLISWKFLTMVIFNAATYLLPDSTSSGFMSPTLRWAKSFSHGEPS